MLTKIFWGISEQAEREVLYQLKEVLTPEEYKDLIAKIESSRNRRIKVELTYGGAGLVERIRTSIFMSEDRYSQFCGYLNRCGSVLVSTEDVMKVWVLFVEGVKKEQEMREKQKAF
tara:strand:+ start:45 stop:392 length:348 start_codon:yes stop_codon:yes gene_type:complete